MKQRERSKLANAKEKGLVEAVSNKEEKRKRNNKDVLIIYKFKELLIYKVKE